MTATGTSRPTVREAHLARAGLADLLPLAAAGHAFPRVALDRVLAARDPLAAAFLADARRRALGTVEVTFALTLRVRGPGLPPVAEDGTTVLHDVSAIAGIAATEVELVGALPPDASPAAALLVARNAVAAVRGARPDLVVRAFTGREILSLAAGTGAGGGPSAAGVPDERLVAVLTDLGSAGLGTLSFRHGCGADPAELAVHRAAARCGMPTAVPIGYGRTGADAAFLDRCEAVARFAAETGRTPAVVVLPPLTDGASPLEGTSGTDDWTAFALARLATAGAVPRVTADWHVTGHKLGAALLSGGADDVVGAQAALRWPAPTDDGPRPVNAPRARAWIEEARRTPVLRDGLHRRVAEPSA